MSEPTWQNDDLSNSFASMKCKCVRVRCLMPENSNNEPVRAKDILAAEDDDMLNRLMTIRKLEILSGTRIPIIGLFASIEIHIRERCLAAGMDDCLSKR